MILLEFEHDVADQVHSDGGSVSHLGHDVMETGSDDHDSSLNNLSQWGCHSMEHVHCHGPALELFHSDIGFSGEVDVLQGESRSISQCQGGARFHHISALDKAADFSNFFVAFTDNGEWGQSLSEDDACASQGA